jgi:hypothetical protein
MHGICNIKIITDLFKKIPAFYANQNLVNIFTKDPSEVPKDPSEVRCVYFEYMYLF